MRHDYLSEPEFQKGLKKERRHLRHRGWYGIFWVGLISCLLYSAVIIRGLLIHSRSVDVYEQLAEGELVQARIRKRHRTERGMRYVYSFTVNGNMYSGESLVSDDADKTIGGNQFIEVYYLTNHPEINRAVLAAPPYMRLDKIVKRLEVELVCIWVLVLACFCANRLYLYRGRRRLLPHLRLLEAITPEHGDPAPRAILEALERENSENRWMEYWKSSLCGFGGEKDDVTFMSLFWSDTYHDWIETQPESIDVHKALIRQVYCIRYLYDISVPTRPIDSSDIYRLVFLLDSNAYKQDDATFRLVHLVLLETLFHPRNVEDRCDKLSIDMSGLYAESSDEGMGLRMMGEVQGEWREVQSPPRRIGKNVVGAFLYFFYCCPWTKDSIKKRIEFEVNGECITMGFHYVPNKSILIEKIDSGDGVM